MASEFNDKQTVLNELNLDIDNEFHEAGIVVQSILIDFEDENKQ